MNVAKIVTVLLFIVVGAIAIYFVLGMLPQTKPLQTQITGYLTLAKDKIMQFMQNPTAAIGTLVTAIGGIGGIVALAKYASSLKQQVSTGISKISGLTQEKDNLLSQVTQEKDKLTQQFNSQIAGVTGKAQTAIDEATNYKTQLSTVQSSFNEIQQQKASLQNQVESQAEQIKKMAAQLEVLVPKVK